MPIPASAAELWNREFPGIRCRLIELAAALDRIDRAADAVADDARRLQVGRSLDILTTNAPNRAERVQMVFSLPYDEKAGIRD